MNEKKPRSMLEIQDVVTNISTMAIYKKYRANTKNYF